MQCELQRGKTNKQTDPERENQKSEQPCFRFCLGLDKSLGSGMRSVSIKSAKNKQWGDGCFFVKMKFVS